MTKHIETAPERIFLQISDTDADDAFPFPENTQDVTWCVDSVVAVEVKYTRADLAKQQRDKLLAALESLVNEPQDITTPAYQNALVVIAEAKGEK